MEIGFTGSQYGMTRNQSTNFIESILHLKPSKFRHGCCIGADSQAHYIIRRYFPLCQIIGHPPINQSKMDLTLKPDIMLEPKEYIERNHDIVDLSKLMIATPYSAKEQIRSGTWATIRYSNSIGRNITILSP